LLYIGRRVSLEMNQGDDSRKVVVQVTSEGN
jgi:hypothetical protein